MPRLNVFVIEDSATIRQNLVAALEEMAPVAVVGFAVDADGAISQLIREQRPCDLVVIDLLLQSGSGVDVLKALQQHPVLRTEWC
ncbi:MAG: response regulator [Rubrivivax sp.]